MDLNQETIHTINGIQGVSKTPQRGLGHKR